MKTDGSGIGVRYAICHYAGLKGCHGGPILVTAKVKKDWTFKECPNDKFDRVLCSWCSN